MPFENVEKNIVHLMNQDFISAEDIVDSMYRLFDDAEAYNKSKNVQDFSVRSIEDFSLAYQDLLTVLYHIFRLHEYELDSLDDKDLYEAREVSKLSLDRLQEKERLLKDLKKEKTDNQSSLDRIDVAEQRIGELNKILAKLKKITPEELEQAVKELENEVKKREAAEEQIGHLTDTKENESKALAQKESEIKVLEKTIETLRGKMGKAESQISGLNDLKTKLEGELSSVDKDALEAVSKLSIIQNAWNSRKNNDEFKTIVEATSIIKSLNTDYEDYEGLKEWFSKVGREIDVAIKTYSEMYRIVSDAVNQKVKTEDSNEGM